MEVVYEPWRWRVLEEKRRRAIGIMRVLGARGLEAIVHGSIARGDVNEDSDIDIVIPYPAAPGIVLYTLEHSGIRPYHVEIIQATPSYTPKVYIYLDPDEEAVVSLPLARLGEREREFYRWGGELDLRGLTEGRRVPGVNKELRLVIPTPQGHVEEDVVGAEARVARILGVSIETVMERNRVLTRRRIHGRTGVFLKEPVDPSTPIEEAIDNIARRVPAFRRKVMG